ncbi:unnamed protein product [Psylliodes chrysocephalus]|uniref:Uncharacterized protein n=1 Tax=Psylliodes chrysocephalus TaxID=3402493 RepID=A0A9P0G2R4_9CUCU|nr:unnamed protein product [Psylliodes chrysocephala]
MARRVVKLHSKYESYQTFEDILDQLEEGEKMNKKCCGWCFICSFKDIGKICGCCGSNRETGDDDLECALVNYVQEVRASSPEGKIVNKVIVSKKELLERRDLQRSEREEDDRKELLGYNKDKRSITSDSSYNSAPIIEVSKPDDKEKPEGT